MPSWGDFYRNCPHIFVEVPTPWPVEMAPQDKGVYYRCVRCGMMRAEFPQITAWQNPNEALSCEDKGD